MAACGWESGSPLALERARGGCGGVMPVLLVAGEGLRGLGKRRLLYRGRAHLQHRSEVTSLQAPWEIASDPSFAFFVVDH